MQRDLTSKAEPYLERKHRRSIWQKVVSVLACVVVFCTTYALILPAITQEHAYCGLAEHTHGAECYGTEETYELACTAESIGVDIVIHTHDSSCYSGETILCKLSEISAHSHGDSCYQITPASEGHTHAETCYDETQALICGLEEAAPTEEIKTLICEKEEVIVHTHTADCGDSCSLPVIIEHVHTEPCKTTITASTDELICTEREHKHSDSCYSNMSADLEGIEDWTATLPKQLTGEYREDIIAVAKTQLGYTESTENYEVMEDGTHKGYTRYGEWYGDKYGDWCAMFVSFCLEYAGVDETVMPQDANCQNWIETLQKEEYNLYHAASSEYVPQTGDLIFFEWGDGDDNSDHVGIVAELIPAEGDTPAMIKTIEGNAGDRVQYREYELDDEQILGYGELPAQEFTCGKTGHIHSSECTDTNSTLVCGVEEHIHEEVCCALPLTEEEQKAVDNVIALIEALPTYEEVDAKLLEYENAEDTEGYEAYYNEVGQQARAAYEAYAALSENQKLYVTNVQKLNDLEWIWSAVTLITDAGKIQSDSPTVGDYTSTREFIELNLYDYNYNINNWWRNDSKYPGFQWNGGAYSKYSSDSSKSYRVYNANADAGIPDYYTDRNYIDSIDFGNSIITNHDYETPTTGDYIGAYQKSGSSIAVGILYHYTSAQNTGKINWLWYNGSNYASTTNRPVGMSTGYQSLSNTLVNGYPALLDNTSLSYLFGDESADTYNAVSKLNTESIDGLFLQNETTGGYSYNSRENHAQYSDNFFTRYNQILTPNFITYPFGNFLPLNSISNLEDATQVGAMNYSGGIKDYVNGIIADLQENTEAYQTQARAQLVTMLQEYAENWSLYGRTIDEVYNNWDNLRPGYAIRDYFFGDGKGNGDAPSQNDDFITQDFLDNLYNIDWDVATNFFFGMEMKMNFMMPKDGLTGNDNGNNTTGSWTQNSNGDYYRTGEADGIPDYPMRFYFTGDDDVWVYIDNQLTLDLTGIHRHVGGSIDFVNGLVHYYELDVENGGDVSSTPYKTVGFEDIFPASSLVTKTATRANDSSIAEDSGLRGTAVQTFKDYTNHSFNFYYMERGSGSSVCRLNFNFPLLRKSALSVSKENVPDEELTLMGNPDYYFNVPYKDGDKGLLITPGTKYTVQNADGTLVKNADGTVKEFYVDEFGIFSIKAGQIALFDSIPENAGEYYVQELIKEQDQNQYNNIVTINGANSGYNDVINWGERGWVKDLITYDAEKDSEGQYPIGKTEGSLLDGSKWYGHSSGYADSSTSNKFLFEVKNGVVTEKLGKLSITKKLKDIETPQNSKKYKMYVLLDGAPLKEGTTYTIGTTPYTVKTKKDDAGNVTATYVEVAPGETAIIEGILSGTEFKIWEEDVITTKEYTGVVYSAVNVDGTTVDGLDNTDPTCIKGIVRESTTVDVTVTNVGDGVPVSIVATKSIPNYDGNTYTFEFLFTQVANANGDALPEGSKVITGTRTATITAESNPVQFEFPLTCDDTDAGKQYYFKVTETVGSDEDYPFIYDSRSYIAEISVTKDEKGALTASVTKIYCGENVVSEIVFENILLSNLTISKEIAGSENNDVPFTFEIVLQNDDLPVIGVYDYTIIKTSDQTVISNSKLEFTESINEAGETVAVAYVDLQGNQTITIENIPYGTTWNVTETSHDGYYPSWQYNHTAEDGSAEIVISDEANGIAGIKDKVDQSHVIFTNTIGYELPESGGIGTNLYIMGGALLIAIAGFLLYKNSKRGKEDYEAS